MVNQFFLSGNLPIEAPTQLGVGDLALLRTRANRLSAIFHLPYTLPSSVCCKSFVCHSYENCRGVGVFFPF
jgi:hypothetical protein